MPKNEKPVKYELIECSDTESDSSEELLSRSFDIDDGRGVITHSYDPDAHCVAKHPTSYIETFINFFKSLVGIGIFSLPAAFAQVGYIAGSVGLFFFTFLSVYCEKILIDTQYELAKRRHLPCMNFQETVEAAFKDGPHSVSTFAPHIKWVAKILINIVTFGSACVYNLVIAENMKAVLDPVWGEKSVRLYMLYLLLPLILINLIKNLKFIAPLSALSNVVIILTIVSVLVFIFKSSISFSNGRPFAELLRLPQFAGTVFFSISAITMILPARNEMRNPRDFANKATGVLFTGSITVLILYWIFGVAGYLKYGDKVSGSITLNLPKNHVAPKLVQSGLAFAIFLSTPINNYVLFEILVNDCVGNLDGGLRIVGEYLIHIVVVIASVALSCAIPNLTLLVSLIGVGANAILAMTIPATIHLMTMSRLSLFYKITDYFIILLSFIFMVTGTIENVESIIKLYSS